jgi:hypothetical protein
MQQCLAVYINDASDDASQDPGRAGDVGLSEATLPAETIRTRRLRRVTRPRSALIAHHTCPIMPDHERVEVPSDDVAMGASDPAVGDTQSALGPVGRMSPAATEVSAVT